MRQMLENYEMMEEKLYTIYIDQEKFLIAPKREVIWWDLEKKWYD